MRYRYILNGAVTPNDPVCDYRLIGGCNVYDNNDAIRIEVPNSMVLEKWSCDSYSTTESKIQIKDLNPVVVVRFNGKMKPRYDITKRWLNGEVSIGHFSSIMHEYGYMPSIRFGYLNKEQYKLWSECHRRKKIWQYKSLSDNMNMDGYLTAEDYAKEYGKHIQIIKDIINENAKYAPFKNYSDVELLDIYAMKCYSMCCDTHIPKITNNDFSKQQMAFMIKEALDDKLFWIEQFSQLAKENKNE